MTTKVCTCPQLAEFHTPGAAGCVYAAKNQTMSDDGTLEDLCTNPRCGRKPHYASEPCREIVQSPDDLPPNFGELPGVPRGEHILPCPCHEENRAIRQLIGALDGETLIEALTPVARSFNEWNGEWQKCEHPLHQKCMQSAWNAAWFAARDGERELLAIRELVGASDRCASTWPHAEPEAACLQQSAATVHITEIECARVYGADSCPLADDEDHHVYQPESTLDLVRRRLGEADSK